MFFGIITPALRRKSGKSFRKKLGVFSFKIGDKHTHKKPGLIPFNLKKQLQEQGDHRGRMLIQKLEQNSHYPFGKFTRKHKFMFDSNKVPFFDVPDLTGFDLKPYVTARLPKFSDELKEQIRKINDYNDPGNFGRFLVNENLPEKIVNQNITSGQDKK